MRRFDDALKAFKRALDLDDSFPLAHYNAGMVLLRSGKPSAASGHFQRLIELVPDDDSFKRVFNRAKFILRCFRQTAGWKLMGMDVSELIKTILHNPGKFEERYREYLDKITQEISLSAFSYDRDKATMAMQKIMSDVRKSMRSIQDLRMNSGLNIDQLRFCLAVLILAKRAEFQNVNNEICLAPSTGGIEGERGDLSTTSFRPNMGNRAGSPSVS
jgi:tetratricopeptide (TPR) repeat protein